MALVVYVNTSANDVSRASAPSDFTQVDDANDYLIFGNGSTTVADGESIPGEAALNSAGQLISESAEVEVSKCFLADISAGTLKEIDNFGQVDKQHVFCFAFDVATASEPVLEIWDDSDMDSSDLYSLGEGMASDSWWYGIVTTDGSPGAGWTGSALAGSSASHFLYLNNGSGAGLLTIAKDLYCNLRIEIPAAFANGAVETPVIVCKYTSN